jgi:hypothetical protein
VPSASAVQLLVDDEGWQLWQALAGLAAPLATNALAIRQPLRHMAPLQI